MGLMWSNISRWPSLSEYLINKVLNNIASTLECVDLDRLSPTSAMAFGFATCFFFTDVVPPVWLGAVSLGYLLDVMHKICHRASAEKRLAKPLPRGERDIGPFMQQAAGIL